MLFLLYSNWSGCLVENCVERQEQIVMGTSGTVLDWILKKKVSLFRDDSGRLKAAQFSPEYHQEYIIEGRESILLHYSTVYQLFTGSATFVL